MFWSRPLLPQEQAFVRRFFGTTLDSLLPRMRLYQRRVGDTRRALSLNGGRISVPLEFFEAGDPRQPLRLAHPDVAGIFAHELLHQWQRLRGVAVTRQALLLQLRALCGGRDPYAYAACAAQQDLDAQCEAMLAQFQAAQVEQQGQIWQDHVSACVAGHPLPQMQRLAQWVRAEIQDKQA